MPVYEYKGQFYDLSETDPAAAKAKILRHLGQAPAPVASAPVTAPAAAFVDAPMFATEPTTGLVEGADYSSTDPFMSAITPPEPKIRPKSVLEGVKAPPPLPTEDPMIRPEFVTAMERRIGALPAQERAAALANLTKRPDVYGRAARVVQGRMGVLEAQQPKPSLISQMFDTPEEQARKQALAQPEVSPLVSGIADPRLEAQVAKLVTEGGMEAGAAEAYARQELEQGRIPRVLPMMRAPTPGEVALERQAQQYEVDQTASGIETAIRAVQRIGKAGELALGKAGGGMQLFLGEMSGADVSGVKDKLGYIAAFNQAMGENPYKPLQIIESAGTSIVQQLPALVAGAITGSQPLVLASMYANSFGDTYADGRERGLDKADSTARAAIFGAFEVLGEKFGLGASLDLIKGAAKGKSLSELAGYFAKQITKEIPGEQLTYAGQFATDKGFGLNPEAGIEEFLRGAAETAIVTATQAGMMLGGAAATSKALRAVGGVRYTPEAPPSVAPPTAPPIPPAPPAQKEPARPAERIEPTIDMGELERVAAGMPERAEPPLEGGRAPIQKMFDELKQVSGLTAEAPPAEAPPVEPAPPPAPPRIEAPPAELLSFEEQIRALEEKQKSLLTKAGKVPAVKSPARKKYDALGEQINALRGQVETPAAPEAPAPTPPVAEAPKVEPPKEAPAAPKPEAPKETPAKEAKPPLLDESNVQRSKKPPEQGGRHPQVQAAAMLLEKGQMTREEYEKYVDAYRPIYSIDIDKMYPPSTPEKMRDALRGDVAKSRLNTPIADGTRVGLRMDLPALDKGVPVVSIHKGKPNEDPKTGEPYASAGHVIGYGSTGYIKDVFFAPRSQEKSLKMGYMPSGKNPLQTAEGKWVNMSPEQVLKRVKELKDDPAWTQVGFDPHRHGYFYDRKTRQPVAKADEMFQIGNFLLAKNVQYAPKEQFLYSIEPEVSRRTPLGFYSALANGIEGIKTNAAPVSGWKEAIKGLVNKGAVKADEVEWSGVNDWLDLQQGKVTKEDLLNYLRQNGVQVEETVLGGRPSMLGGDMERLLELQDERELTPEEEKQLRELRATPKFGRPNLVLPGGENYREVLLTLPKKEDQSLQWKKTEDGFSATANGMEVWVHDIGNGNWTAGIEGSEYVRAGSADEAKAEIQRRLIKELGSETAGQNATFTGNYRSTHWDQPNVIAHIRMNDRTDADGNKVLFVEEIQSDWGQEGKKRGFAKTSNSITWEYAAIDLGLNPEERELMSAEEIAEIDAHLAELRRGAAPAQLSRFVPTAPFVTKTEGWLNLALKRIMVMAAEGGYDKVAFVNGDQSADRYDLSKQIERIEAWKDGPTYSFNAYRAGSDGRFPTLSKENLSSTELADNIGKEMAERIIARTDGTDEEVMEFTGLDLKVGGEGMKAFYDRIVPLAIKKLLPKVGGGQMGGVEVSLSGDASKNTEIPWNTTTVRSVLQRGGEVYAVDRDLGGEQLIRTEEDLQEVLDQFTRGNEPTAFIYGDSGGFSVQPGFDVTPAMREKVETTGLPLFSLNPSINIAVTGNPAQRSPSFKREVAKLKGLHTRGLMSDEVFAKRIDDLIEADARRRFDKQMADIAKGRVRGADWILEKLRGAKRKGEISDEAYKLAEWFINGNPRLVEELGISIVSPGERGVAGQYDVNRMIMVLVKDRGNDLTAVHEILHHLERMMPPDIQAAIRKEWTKQLLDAKKKAKTPQEKLYYEALMAHHFGEGRMSFDNVPKELRELYTKLLAIMDVEGERVNAMTLANHLLKTGGVDRNLYQYYSPSEFWAVNGSDIVRGRYDAIKGGLLTRLKNWLRELGEKIKSIFGLKSEAALIRALDSLAKADGKFVTKQILDQTQVAYGIEPEKKQTDTPEFKRWFGDSKVVDENGEPLVVYHHTPKTFDAFIPGGFDSEISGIAIWMTPERDVSRAPFAHQIYTAIRQGRGIDAKGNKISADAVRRLENGTLTAQQAKVIRQRIDEAVDAARIEGVNTMPLYVAIKNPLILRGPESSKITLMYPDRVAEIRSQGYDGVMAYDKDGILTEIVAFDPTQIKSAIGNIGTFDPTDPNILYSIEPDRKAAPKKMIEPATIDRLRESWTVGRDELGRPNFGPGAKAYDTVARITNVVLDKILMKPISPELGRAMRNMKVEIDKAQKKVATLGKELSKLSSQERELISDVIEGELKADVIPPQHIIDIAASMVEIMSAQGQEMVRLGMLSKEAFMRWENKYLPRFYLNNLGKETKAWATATKRLLMKQPTMQGIKGQQLKSRGMYQQIYTEDLPDWIAQGWEQRDADFDPKTSVETVVWRDYTREEREEMGEIRDAMFRFVMGYNASQRDIALGRLYESLSENYASKSPIEGYVRVPETMVEGTNVNRYGKLAGMYVPKEIMDHLVWNDKAMSNGLYKLYQAGLGRWKEGKTVLNPTAHANNVFSNFTMAHFAGVSYWDVEKYAGALKDFVTNDEMLKEAEDIGLFTGTFSQTEMVENMPAELKQLANMTGSQLAKYGDKAWDLLSLTLEWDGKKYGVRPMMKWMYENEDFFFRYLIYRDARNRGMEPEDAREYSNQFIFTYDDLPAGARVVRDIGMPFFSYTYKVVPVLARTALEYPWRFAAPAAAVYTLNALMYSIAASVGGDEDDWWGKTLYKYVTDKDFRQKANQLEEEERKNLPSWMKGKSSLGTEKAIRLGMDDITGLPLFLDISRIFPGGDLLDAENNAGGLALLQPLTPSNPVLTSLVAMLANKDMFLGKDVVLATDTDAEKARKRAAWLWKQWAPAISVGNYHFDRGMNTIANMTGKPITVDAGPMGVIDYTGIGKDGLPVIPKYAALQTFGVKVRPYDLEVSAAIEKSKQDRLIKELAIEIKRINRLEEKGSISPAAAELLRSQAQNKQELLKDGLTVEGKPKK